LIILLDDLHIFGWLQKTEKGEICARNKTVTVHLRSVTVLSVVIVSLPAS